MAHHLISVGCSKVEGREDVSVFRLVFFADILEENGARNLLVIRFIAPRSDAAVGRSAGSRMVRERQLRRRNLAQPVSGREGPT